MEHPVKYSDRTCLIEFFRCQLTVHTRGKKVGFNCTTIKYFMFKDVIEAKPTIRPFENFAIIDFSQIHFSTILSKRYKKFSI